MGPVKGVSLKCSEVRAEFGWLLGRWQGGAMEGSWRRWISGGRQERGNCR